jgi:hypothetical protein
MTALMSDDPQASGKQSGSEAVEGPDNKMSERVQERVG